MRAKDFIETAPGLLFAVLSESLEDGRIPCFLRYALAGGRWRKVATVEANQLLAAEYPHYLFHSRQRDAHLHAVLPADVIRHYEAQTGLQTLLNAEASDQVSHDFQQLCRLLKGEGLLLDELGISGSLLLGLQNPHSDIDLVCFNRDQFQLLRQAVQKLISGRQLQALAASDWLESYQRRACALSLTDYVWHERRKFNKALINGRKFDISLLGEPEPGQGIWHKHGPVLLQARVLDDYYGFDYPARYGLDHPEIKQVAIYTATYSGQAMTGERVEIAGQLESDQQGLKRLIIGASREAPGEYIKVLHD